jgi:heme b synthase
LIAWEVTRSCHLNCRHCRGAARFGPYENELSYDEICKTLKNIAAFAKPIIILTGGEPMLREDIYDIARYGTELGLSMAMSPCGKMITRENAAKIAQSGIKRISISLDGASAESHDNFRRVPGAFEGALQGIKAAQAEGIEFMVNTTVTRLNVRELPDILQLAIDLGAVAFSPFLLVPTGRGKELAEMEITPEEYESVLNWIYDKKKQDLPIQLRPTCAPHFYRIFRQREREQGRCVSPQTHGMDAMSKGCMGGQGFAFISHVGRVQACGFLDISCGDIRTADYDFESIWQTSPEFMQMRDLDHYHGKCGYCEYRRVCGGCRARAYVTTGDFLAAEPFCIYEPNRKPETLKEAAN